MDNKISLSPLSPSVFVFALFNFESARAKKSNNCVGCREYTLSSIHSALLYIGTRRGDLQVRERDPVQKYYISSALRIVATTYAAEHPMFGLIAALITVAFDV